MNGITAKKALLETCFDLEDENNLVARREKDNEERMQADADWTGIVVKRFHGKEEKKELESMGYQVFITDKHYLDKLSSSVKSR